MKRWLGRRREAPGGFHASGRRRPGGEGPFGPAEIAGVLECACKDATPAVVLVRETGEVLRGRFEGIEPSRVRLGLDPTAGVRAPQPLSVCGVTFGHDDKAFVFLAPVWGLTEDPRLPGRRVLSLGLPGQIATLDVGAARRIPIGMGVTLSIEVGTYDRRTWSPEAVDLSASGILLEFGPRRPPRLPVGALVEVALELDGVRAELMAAVRRREGSRLGLSFVDVAPGAALTPPEPLREILAKLEERWLEAGSAQSSSSPR